MPATSKARSQSRRAAGWCWLLLTSVLTVIFATWHEAISSAVTELDRGGNGVISFEELWDGKAVAQRQQEEILAGLSVDRTVADHPLTAAERAQFEASGMLVIPAALTASEVADLDAALEWWSRETTDGAGVQPGATWHGMTFSARHDVPSRHPALVRMLAHPRVLGKVAGILGWNIYIYHAHAVYTRAAEGATARPIEPSGDHWHQDSGRVNADVEGVPRPRLSVKASIFLTDTTHPAAPQVCCTGYPCAFSCVPLPLPSGYAVVSHCGLSLWSLTVISFSFM